MIVRKPKPVSAPVRKPIDGDVLSSTKKPFDGDISRGDDGSAGIIDG